MNRRDPGFDVWVVVADMLVGFLCIVFLLRAVHPPPPDCQACRVELEEARRRIQALRAELENARRVPPIITLSETEARFRFHSGSADLSPSFRESLSKDVVPQILRAKEEYSIDTVQVIGHTDEVPLSNVASTLDKSLIIFIRDNAAVTPGSNTDLAMLRAIAVLKALQGHPDLTGIKLVPYSAGQILLPPDDKLSEGEDKGQNPERRRVVIRLTRSGTAGGNVR